MSSFSLRPVADHSPSPTPSVTMSPPPTKGGMMNATSPVTKDSRVPLRRPLSPSSLRDVDLNQNPEIPSRKWAVPLTGHDLMAMFPPPPPDNSLETRAGPTSGFFQRQERAFFAQAGKEIVRVRLEIDIQNGNEDVNPSKRSRVDSRPGWSPHSPHHSPHSSISGQGPPPPALYAQQAPYPRPPPPRGTVPSSAPLYPVNGPPPPTQVPNPHAPRLHTPPDDLGSSGGARPEYQHEEYDDESWRRPMPYAERRRAGKHTRRVIVR